MTAAGDHEPLAQENHYVPRSHMRRWSSGDDRVWAYRTLVPRASQPLWWRTPIARIAKQRHLYTSVAAGRESDRIERWLNVEVETPALAVLEKLTRGGSLSPKERRILARYVAALDRRGPVEYSENTQRLAAEMPGLIEGVLENVVKWATGEVARRGQLPAVPGLEDPFPLMKVQLRAAPTAEDPDRAEISVDLPIGRELWLNSIEQCVNQTSKVLEEHDWRVVAPHPGWRWFTSDHPVLRLNFTSFDAYDFGGGWARPGSEILLPLSPSHLLYTQVGRSHELEVFGIEQTVLIHRLLAQRAYRWILADGQPRRMAWFRPRRVDLEAYLDELDAWRRWHEEQSAAHDVAVPTTQGTNALGAA